MPIILRKQLTQSRAKELFNYDPDTGIMVRAVDVHSGRGSANGGGKIQCYAGDVVGTIDKGTGYATVLVDREKFVLHRLVWLWWYGYTPENEIDHINRDKLDNRISNLREVSRSCNVRNTPVDRDSTSKIKGVSFCKRDKKWLAYIRGSHKQLSLGAFSCKVEAAAHRYAAEQALDWLTCATTSTARQFLIDNKIIKPHDPRSPLCPPDERR